MTLNYQPQTAPRWRPPVAVLLAAAALLVPTGGIVWGVGHLVIVLSDFGVSPGWPGSVVLTPAGRAVPLALGVVLGPAAGVVGGLDGGRRLAWRLLAGWLLLTLAWLAALTPALATLFRVITD